MNVCVCVCVCVCVRVCAGKRQSVDASPYYHLKVYVSCICADALSSRAQRPGHIISIASSLVTCVWPLSSC